MLDQIKIEALSMLKHQNFDSLAFGIIDFNSNKFETFEIREKNKIDVKPPLFFDLASLTKALTNSIVAITRPEIFTDEMQLLLNHKAGITSGGRLSKYNWREQILSYKIIESETLYSDYSSLRLMLEIEKKTGKRLSELVSFYFDPEMKYWLSLKNEDSTPATGYRDQKIIHNLVHDDNCFVISEFVSHAGLFSTVNGLCQSLINLKEQTKLFEVMTNAFQAQKDQDRFILGFDRPMDINNTLAGLGCSKQTFGHLGFTGTSFWIDLNQMKGSVILTNATQNYWYERSGLTDLRKSLGAMIWKCVRID
jgi:CubicO group peptidase (beta-lactamase class C family)